MNKRIAWIDSLRAIAVFAVVLGHTLRNATVVYPWVYSFHVPLCVFTSGLVFSVKGKSFGEFFKKKFLALMVPYYCFALISIVIYALLGKVMEGGMGSEYNVSFLESLLGMLWANAGTGLMRWNMPLWYLPMIFVAELLGYGVYKKADSFKAKALIFAGSLAAAVVIYEFLPQFELPLGAETAVFMFPFFAMGKLLQHKAEAVSQKNAVGNILLGGLLTVAGTVLAMQNSQVSYNADNYGQLGYLYFFAAALVLSCGISLLTAAVGRDCRWLGYVGRSTMAVLVMHKFPILFFAEVLPPAKRLMTAFPLPAGILIALVSSAMCVLAGVILERIFPWAIGKKPRKNSVKNMSGV